MPHVLLAGAPTGCWTNLGDEAILAGMADALRAAIPEVRLTVVSSSPAQTYVPYDCESVHFKDIPGIMRAVAGADAILLGGGSIFFDYWDCDATRVLTDGHRGPELWAGLALLAAAFRVPVMTYDVGLNPLLTADGLTLTRAVLQLASAITVRDHASAALALEWGLESDKVVVTGDPAIAVDLDRGTDLDGGADVGESGGPVLAVAIRQWETGISDQDLWNTALAAAIDAHLTRAGGRVEFVPCHIGQRWPLTDDTAAAQAVIDRMYHADRAEIVSVELPWSVRAARLARADAVLAMRYHAALFALRSDVPTVGLSYDAKVAGLFGELGVADRCLELAEAAEDPDRIVGLLSDPTAGASSQGEDAALALKAGVAHMRRAERVAATVAAHLVHDNVADVSEALAGAPAPDVAALDHPAGGDAALGEAAPDRAAPSSRPRPTSVGTTATPSWRRDKHDAVRQLLTIVAPDDDTRSEAVRDALARLAERLDLAPPRRAVAILTSRLVTKTGDRAHIGGTERYALSLATLLRDLGLAVTFYQGGGEFEVADFHGFPVYPLPLTTTVSEFQIGAAEEFHRRTFDSDHVLYLTPHFASATMREDAVLVSHGVWWDHELWTRFAIRSPEWQEQLRQVFTAPARVISVDANTGNVLRAQLGDVGHHIREIASAVDTTTFTPPHSADQQAADQQAEDEGSAGGGPGAASGLAAIGRQDVDEPIVLFPRRAEPIRGSELVEPIMRLVPDPCRFRWVGDGSRFAALKKVADHDSRLTVRRATFEQMPKQYAAADICVIPSVGSEGQSLSALEAMASGCAVIVTRIGGLVEVVTDDVDGLVCDPTADSVAAAIRRLVRDPGLRVRLGAAARATALRHHELGWRSRWAEELAELGWFDHGRAASAAAPYDIIKFSVIDFEQRYQRPQQIASAWGRRGRRVFYIQRTGHRPPGGAPYHIREVADGVYTVRLALPAGFNLFRRPANKAETEAALRSLDALRSGWNIDRAVAFTEFGSWQPVAAAARERWGWPVHYDCMDNWSTFPEVAARSAILTAERTLVTTADSMTVSGRAIQRHWSTRRPGAVLARNAADFDRFHDVAANDVPAATAHLSGPVAGFIGDVTTWFDTEIVRQIATCRPDVQFVFVGNVKKQIDLDAVATLANVHFLGLQPYADMPRYVRRFDVCLVPFTVDEATASMDLVKVYEYLAAGKPVVTTPVAEMVRYRDYLYLADGPDEFLRQLDAALDEDDGAAVERRLAFARLNSWDDRVDVLEQTILPTLASGAGKPTATAERRAATAAAKLRRVERDYRDSQRQLTRAQQELRRTRGKLQKLSDARAIRLVRRYWSAREKAHTITGAASQRTRRAAGSVARRIGMR